MDVYVQKHKQFTESVFDVISPNKCLAPLLPLELFYIFFKNVKNVRHVFDVFSNYVKNVHNVTTSKNLQKIYSFSIL